MLDEAAQELDSRIVEAWKSYLDSDVSVEVKRAEARVYKAITELARANSDLVFARSAELHRKDPTLTSRADRVEESYKFHEAMKERDKKCGVMRGEIETQNAQNLRPLSLAVRKVYSERAYPFVERSGILRIYEEQSGGGNPVHILNAWPYDYGLIGQSSE